MQQLLKQLVLNESGATAIDTVYRCARFGRHHRGAGVDRHKSDRQVQPGCHSAAIAMPSGGVCRIELIIGSGVWLRPLVSLFPSALNRASQCHPGVQQHSRSFVIIQKIGGDLICSPR